MPSTVGVLEAHQSLTDNPRPIKRSAAQSLVRRNLARQISKRLIQMLSVREVGEILLEQRAVRIKEYDPADSGALKDIRPPDWIFTSYPIRDDRTVIV